jgi:cytochrome c nitrite reductase small subunit
MRSTTAVGIVTVSLAVVVGVLVGLGGFTFVYAGGHSYLSSDPKACVNCHVMREQYDGWIKSSHHAVATCNDCHMPKSLAPKLFTKASNGFWHSLAFTTGDYPDPIRIKPSNWQVAENSCRRCHGQMVEAMDTVHRNQDRASCIRCHGSVGHPNLMPPGAKPAR